MGSLGQHEVLWLDLGASWSKKDSVDSAKYDITLFYLYLKFLGVFFMRPEPNFLDPDFLPIRTREKKADPDPIKRTRTRNTATHQKIVLNVWLPESQSKAVKLGQIVQVRGAAQEFGPHNPAEKKKKNWTAKKKIK